MRYYCIATPGDCVFMYDYGEFRKSPLRSTLLKEDRVGPGPELTHEAAT